jgi:hypothetical protein
VQPRTSFDDSWEQSEKITDGWLEGLFEDSTLRAIGAFIVKQRGGVKSYAIPKPGSKHYIPHDIPRRGLCNNSISPTRRDNVPWRESSQRGCNNSIYPGKHVDPSTLYPTLGYQGGKSRLRPFHNHRVHNHKMNMTKALNMPDLRIEDRPHLDLNIDIDKLELLYRQMADTLLQLSKLSLPRIGLLEQIDNFTFKVCTAPCQFI